MIRSHAHSASKAPTETWRFLLPTASGDIWTLDVPASLADCVGRYARLPELVGKSHVLTAVRLTG